MASTNKTSNDKPTSDFFSKAMKSDKVATKIFSELKPPKSVDIGKSIPKK